MISLIISYYTGKFIDVLINEHSTKFIDRFILFFVGISVIDIILSYINDRLYIKLQAILSFDLNFDIINHIHKSKIENISK